MRLLIYDDTCRGRGASPGLTHSWIAGALLYRSLGRLDAARGVTSWSEGLRFLVEQPGHALIREIQFWGHGKWGEARIRDEALGRRALDAAHPLHTLLADVSARLAPGALVWFRTCETLGADAGHAFATEFAAFTGARVAGHTFIIGPWQSGLHSLGPGERPTWSSSEGIADGNPASPRRALWSGPRRPHTIHCLQSVVPPGY
jgi:hypothetical protein